MYAQYKTELEVYQLVKNMVKKLAGSNNTIRNERMYYRDKLFYISRKNNDELKAVKAKHDEYVKRLDTNDWRYFAEEELKDKESKIKDAKEMQEKLLIN